MSKRSAALTRRQWLQQMGSFAAVAALAPACVAARGRGFGASPQGSPLPGASAPEGLLGFEPLGIETAATFGGDATKLDVVRLAKGYRHQVLFPWGAAFDGSSDALRVAATADEQQRQAGMHHDGMAFFPHDASWDPATRRLAGRSDRGLLVMNHEYTDEGLLHADGIANWSDAAIGAAKVAKSKCAQGVSVVAIEREDGKWRVTGGRRIGGRDPIDVRGPARDHALLRSSGERESEAQRAGTEIEGTFANCANGQTPWGTYLTCEENFQDYFARSKKSDDAKVEARMKRYGIGKSEAYVEGWRSVYGWDAHDPRFDADVPATANHCHRFGWVVEIDPFDATRRPAKRTALGRFSHENAAVVIAPDGRVVVYLGDDKRFEHVYKFVSRDKFEPIAASDDDATRKAKRERHWKLLDEGTLHVAFFDPAAAPDGQGEREGRWIALTPEHEKLKGRELAEILVFARESASAVDATKMDRPEWIAVLPGAAPGSVAGVFVTLTNNDKRGGKDEEGPTPSNPREKNVYGHLLRWREQGDDPAATAFRWKVAIQCGDRKQADEKQRGDVRDALGRDDQDFGSPDGLFVDPRGVLWVQTDVNVRHFQNPAKYPGYEQLGNNQMFAVDPATLEVRRFLVGPNGCEITGVAMTPDASTLFVNVQHPGEVDAKFADPAKPCAISAWPPGLPGDARPRSATLVITRAAGGPVGT